MKKTIIKVLIAGLLLRLFLSFITYHSDIVPFDFAGRVISEGNVTNFYDYLWQIPNNHPYLSIYPRDLFNYPPLPYFFLGGISRLTTILINPVFHDTFFFDFPSTLGFLQLNFLLFFLKLPYFVFDLAIAFLLMRLFKKKENKIKAFALWMFNPITLYATYMMGQFDIIPTFFVVLSLVLTTYNLPLSAAALGLGGGFKIFPMLFLIPLALVGKNWNERTKIFFAGVVTYIITSYPFIFSQGFRKTALLAGQTTKSLYAQIPISGGESIILFLAFVIFFYLLFYFKKTTSDNLWKRYFVMLLLFFIFTHYHPQWFLWITPFLIIDLIGSNFKNWLLIILSLLSFFVLVTFFDPGLTTRIFSPINKNLYTAPGIWEMIGINPDINLLRSVFQTVFVGSALYYLYLHFPKKHTKRI